MKKHIINACLTVIYFIAVLLITTSTLLKLGKTIYFIITIPILILGTYFIKRITFNKIK